MRHGESFLRAPGPGRRAIAFTASLRCPACRQQGTFERLSPDDHDIALDATADPVWVGNRRCPNPNCHAYVFVAWRSPNEIIAYYPPERIDFDATDLPTGVIAALEEAITCHANGCYKAAAIMVRKTLEELCRDRLAEGVTLKDRIAALESKVILPKELLEGLDSLRLLGNDAAHIESKVYDDVGSEEVEVGIAVVKEVLKAVYQYSALVQQLDALKKKQQPTQP